MNRALTIPAACCLVAFAAVVAALPGATGRERAARTGQLAALSRYSNRDVPDHHADPGGPRLLTSEQARERLTALTGEYLRPRREWESSPHRYFSRASPGRLPSASAKIELAQEGSETGYFQLASIVVTKGARSQAVPCVVDRRTGQVHLFEGGKWLPADQWVKTAPLP